MIKLIALYDYVASPVDEERAVDTVYLDFEKVFHPESHNIRNYGLRKYGLEKWTQRCLKSWLNCQGCE